MSCLQCARLAVTPRMIASRITTAPLLTTPQIRTTTVMKRLFDVPLADLGKTPHLKRLQFVYEPHNTLEKRIPDMTVVLTQYVEGVGDVGDVVTVRAYLARNELLLPGLAVYNTPENVDKYTKLKLDRPRRTPFCMKTLKQLESETLYIPMNARRESPLNKNHVRIAFRLSGVELTDDCIVLPQEPITSDHQDQFILDVVINRVFTARVRARVYNYQLDPTGKPLPPPRDHDDVIVTT